MVNSDVSNKPVKIWDVISGPYPCEHPDIDFHGTHFNLCKVEVNGKIENIEYFFESFDEAYEMIKYFSKNIEPIELEVED
ncbi:MAG: hypothetical protein CMJ25_31590 [Phycisphaerae bacterium]|nr:hypothetical protein [Phycisphaerae bacterium]